MRISKEDKSGMYLTVIIHLGLLIVLLVSQIATAVKGENSYLIDFSDIEQREMEEAQASFRESISDRLDEMIAAAGAAAIQENRQEEIRNIAVDAGTSYLKDDRNTDVEQLYREAERLAENLKSGAFAREIDNSGDYAALPEAYEPEQNAGAKVYSGPSVVSPSFIS